jgi:hypothetical protein
MVGFIIGAVVAIGIVKALRRHHGWGGACGRGYGMGYHGGYGPGWGGGGPRSWFLRSLFERLETSPGQEKAILAALEELRENRRALRDEARQTRDDIARVVAGGLVEDGSLEETFHRHDRLAAQLRVSFVEALKKVTEVLDEGQRKKIARFLESGGMPRWGGPYRGMWV